MCVCVVQLPDCLFDAVFDVVFAAVRRMQAAHPSIQLIPVQSCTLQEDRPPPTSHTHSASTRRVFVTAHLHTRTCSDLLEPPTHPPPHPCRPPSTLQYLVVKHASRHAVVLRSEHSPPHPLSTTVRRWRGAQHEVAATPTIAHPPRPAPLLLLLLAAAASPPCHLVLLLLLLLLLLAAAASPPCHLVPLLLALLLLLWLPAAAAAAAADLRSQRAAPAPPRCPRTSSRSSP